MEKQDPRIPALQLLMGDADDGKIMEIIDAAFPGIFTIMFPNDAEHARRQLWDIKQRAEETAQMADSAMLSLGGF